MLNSNEIAEQLKRYCEENDVDGQTLAKAIDIDQSQMSRILSGKFRDIVGTNVEKVCKYAGIDLGLHTQSPDYDPFIAALDEVWDGTPKRQKALVKVIKSLKGLS